MYHYPFGRKLPGKYLQPEQEILGITENEI